MSSLPLERAGEAGTSPYRIAIIAGQLVVGGAERQLYLWLSHMDRSRFEPVVVTLHPDCGDHWEKAVEELGVPLLRVARGRHPIVRLLGITRALRPYRPQLIHGWHLFTSPYAGAAATMLGARASLGSLRGSFRAYRQHRAESTLTNWLTDGMLVNSAWAGRQVAGARWRPRRAIHAVPNAVEDVVEKRAVARPRLSGKYSISPGSIWIGSAGRMQRSKRFDLLVDVTAGLRGAGLDVSLLLIGYGEMMDSLRARAAAQGISDHVAFTGEDADARLWMSALDIFCFLSEDEGLPNVVMEAAAAGVPVVAWRTPFLEEILEGGHSAILVPPGDMEGLRKALAALINDPCARERIGGAGRTRVLENFSVARFVAGMTDTYEALLAGNPR